MKAVDRHVLRRFSRDLARYTGLFAAIGMFVLLGRLFGRHEGWPPWAAVDETIGRSLRLLELAVQLGAPLAIVVTLTTLARRGPLLGVCAAGYGARDLRRVLWIAGGITVGLTAAVQAAEMSWSTSRAEASGKTLWSANGFHTVCLDYDAAGRHANNLVVFRDADLAISTIEELEFSAEDSKWVARRTRVLVGPPFSPESVPTPERAQGRRSRKPAGNWPVIIIVNRACLGGCLVVLLGYVALVVPVALVGVTLAAFVVTALITGYAMLWIHIQLWRGTAMALVIELLVWTIWAATLVWLHRRFARRGLRLR